jgi:hypothetical protein
MQFYDPDQLIQDVLTHLDAQGRTPRIPDDKKTAAHIAACQLLIAMDITPAMDGAAALGRAINKIWSETD